MPRWPRSTRLSSPSAETLAGISQKARTKAAQKRARLLAKAFETPAPVETTPAVTYPEAEQERARALVAQMTALGAADDLAAVREGYGASRVAWVELLADADIQPDLVETFETASGTVRDRIAADDRARMEAEQQRQARAREQAERAEVCARVEAIQGDDIPDQVASARAEWEGMPAMPESWAAELNHRFEEACRAAEKRHERRLTAKEMAERLPALLPEMEALAAAENYTEVRSQWFALRKQWQAIARELEIDPELTSRYDLAAQAIEAKEQVLRDAKAGDQQKNLQRLQAVVLELETRAAAESLTLKGADTLMKDIKLAIGTMGPLPTKQDRDDLTVRLQAVRTSLAPRIQEMREGEEWKRWANVQVQEELCTKMEALVAIAEAEPEKAATEMKELQERWKSVAAAPRSQADGAVDPLQGGAGPGLREVQGLLRAAERRARREPEEEDRAGRARRGAAALERLGEDGRRDQAAAGRLEDHRPGDARQRARDLGALPRRLRRVLHAPPGRPEAAQARLDREPPQEGGARHRSRAAGAVVRVGEGRGAHQADAAGLEEHRTGEAQQVGSDLAAVPRRVRPVLRALQEPRSGGAAGQGRRSRDARWPSSRRWYRPTMPATCRCRPISTPTCRRRAPAGCRVRSCRGTRCSRWPIASTRRC